MGISFKKILPVPGGGRAGESVSSLDEEVRSILLKFQVRRARVGETLACSACGRAVEFTYRTVCGKCYLAGREGRPI